MDKKIVFIASGIVTFVGLTVTERVLEKRNEKREREEILANRVRSAHFYEQAERINDDLQRRIDIAKKALLDDDFNQITRHFDES